MKIIDFISSAFVIFIFIILAYLRAYSTIIIIIMFAGIYIVICMFNISKRTQRIIYWIFAFILGIVMSILLDL